MSSEEDELDLDSLNISAKKEDGIARVYVLHCIGAPWRCGPFSTRNIILHSIFYTVTLFLRRSSDHGATWATPQALPDMPGCPSCWIAPLLPATSDILHFPFPFRYCTLQAAAGRGGDRAVVPRWC